MQRFFGKSLIVIYAFAILPSVSAKADEALFIHGIQKDNRKEYVSSIGFGRKPDQMPYLRTWLYFPKTRELKTNNLIPDLKTRKQRDLSVIYPAASP